MTPTPRERARRAFLEMPDDPSEADFMEVVTAAVQAERNAGDLRREEVQAALTAALEDLARVKQQAHDNHIGTGHASAALNRVLLHVTGCSAGEYDTYAETAERIIERLKDDAQHMEETSEAFVQTTNELMAAQAELAKVKQERDGLAAALALLMNPQAERLNGYYREPKWREYDDMRGSHFLTNLFLSIGEVVMILDAQRDASAVLAARDRAVAARVLRALGSTAMDILDWEAVRRIADQYERGELEVPGEQ